MVARRATYRCGLVTVMRVLEDVDFEIYVQMEMMRKREHYA